MSGYIHDPMRPSGNCLQRLNSYGYTQSSRPVNLAHSRSNSVGFAPVPQPVWGGGRYHDPRYNEKFDKNPQVYSDEMVDEYEALHRDEDRARGHRGPFMEMRNASRKDPRLPGMAKRWREETFE